MESHLPYLLAVQDRRHIKDEATWVDLARFPTWEAAAAHAATHCNREVTFVQDAVSPIWEAEAGAFSFVISYQPTY